MDLIIACFTEAPHNPVAAFLAAGITAGILGYAYIGIQALSRMGIVRSSLWRK